MNNILKDNNIVLKDNNPWAQFNGTTSKIVVGTTSTFGWMNNGIFRIEFDVIFTALNAASPTLCTCTTTAGHKGFRYYFNTGRLRFYWMSNGTNYYCESPILIINTKYHYITYGDGVTITQLIYQDGILISTTTCTPVFVPNATTTTSLSIGDYSIYFMAGYLRNIKIYRSSDASNLFAHFPLQDVNAVSRDVIGGLSGSTVTDVNVVNQIETENWAYFNNTLVALATIGTTSTFGWMNSGVFNLSFDYKAAVASGNIIRTTGGVSTAVIGIYLYWAASNNVRLYWMNGSGAYGVTLNITSIIAGGKEYKFTIKGDGANIQMILYDYATTSNVYDSGLVACTYVPNPTTTASLGFSLASSPTGMYIRNFKVYTDFAGTIPFMSLPMQDAPTLMTDRVGGLQGTATAVSIVNNNTNVLRTKDLWCKFGDGVSTGLGHIQTGTAASYNWLHQTGIFRMEVEATIETLLTTDVFFTTRVAAAGNGMYLFHSPLNLGERLYCYFGSGGLNLTTGKWDIFTSVGTYKIILIGDGTGITCWAGLNGATPTSFGTLSFANPIVASGNAALVGTIGGYPNTTYAFRGKIRNLKFYNTQDTSGLVYNFPLQDGGAIGKDVKGVLNGTINGELKVVEV